MTQKLYLECKSGISGDMTVGALLDLGADETVLRKALASLPLKGFEVVISRVKKAGLDACDFLVKLDAAHENHDHDMAYLYGFRDAAPVADHGHVHEHGHEHGHEYEHEHEHTHAQEHGHDHLHHHEHRGLAEILDILDRAELSDGARSLARKIFTILGEAEAEAHGTTLDQVHFHEVGAVDSIVDITAAAVCLDNLGIKEAVIPVLNEGTGSIRCAHGILPVPVPAVTSIVSRYGLLLHIMETDGEYVTPTGAAIAAALCTEKHLPERFCIVRTGCGAGKRTQARPSLLRAMLIDVPDAGREAVDHDTIWKLETNLDDCTSEALGHLQEILFEAGARDVEFSSVYMKKNRPGWLVTVLCSKTEIPVLEAVLFSETTTIGIRRAEMSRTILFRTERTLRTSLGPVRVKEVRVPLLSAERTVTGKNEIRRYPEYESVAALCRQTGRSYQSIWQQIIRELADAKEE